jgi:hypothetical protein
MQFDVILNIAVAIVTHPPLFGSAVRFSHVEEQGQCIVYNKVKASAIAQIGFLTKREIVQLQGKGVYVAGFTRIWR